MIKKIITKASDWLEERLRSLVRPLSPDARVIVIVTMLVVFSGLSVCMTVSSIYNMGKKSGRQQMEIEHIERPELEPERQQETDSINHKNNFNYEQ